MMPELWLSPSPAVSSYTKRSISQPEAAKATVRWGAGPLGAVETSPGSEERHQISASTQTELRESGCQTEPCTLDYFLKPVLRGTKFIDPEVAALASLRHGRGLPAVTLHHLDLVDSLRLHKLQLDQLPALGEPQRPSEQKKILRRRQAVEFSLDQQSSRLSLARRTQQMNCAMEELSSTSAAHLELRLNRMWHLKQQEQEHRLRLIRKIHDKEHRALEKQCRDLKRSLVYPKGDHGRWPTALGPLEDQSLTASSKGAAVEGCTRTPRSRKSVLTNDFVSMYDSLKALETSTTRQMARLPGQIQLSHRRCSSRSDTISALLDKAHMDIESEKYQCGQKKCDRKHILQLFRIKEKADVRLEVAGGELQLALGHQDKETSTRQYEELQCSSSPADHRVQAFMEDIQGQALGHMIDYLTSHLESLTERGAYDHDPSEQERSQALDHTVMQISKVTQSTLSRYMDKILLEAFYQHTEPSVHLADQPPLIRRHSDLDRKPGRSSVGFGLRGTIKAFQRRILVDLHNSFVAVVAEVKGSAEVEHKTRSQLEQSIRAALDHFLQADNLKAQLEKSLRAANLLL